VTAKNGRPPSRKKAQLASLNNKVRALRNENARLSRDLAERSETVEHLRVENSRLREALRDARAAI